nr:hypothetical protein [Tanacetum cinerariifolium]
MEEIDLSFNPDDPMPPSIEDDDNESEENNLFLERLLHDDPIPLSDTLDFSNVVRVFLPFFTYPVTSSILHPFGNEDTIFDPCITINHFYSFKPGLSHRYGAFKKFNIHRSHLNEWTMIINGKNITILDRLLYDNSSPRPPKEFNSENSNDEIETFSPSPIPNKDIDSFMEEIDLFLTPDDPMPPSIEDDEDSEGDILFLERLLHDDPIPLQDTLDFSYEANASVIISIPSLVGGVADVVVEIKGTKYS